MKKMVIRVICLLIAAFFVISFVVAAAVSSNATDTSDEDVIDPLDTANTLLADSELLLRVGIVYSDDCAEGYRIRPSHEQLGYDLYSTEFEGGFEFIYTIEESDVFFAKGGNLYRYDISSSKSEYRTTDDTKEATIGGYHILLPTVYDDFYSMNEDIKTLKRLFPETSVIPSYIDGKHRILFDHYFTENEAASVLESDIFSPLETGSEQTQTEDTEGTVSEDTETAAETADTEGTATSSKGETQAPVEDETQAPVEDATPEVELYGASLLVPGDTEVVLLDYATGDFLFYFDMNGEYGFGCYPNRSNGEYNYLKTVDGYYRPGVFEFKRYIGDGVDAIALVTVTDIEEYVESVVPWEIYTTWPLETIKAFAISVRTFAIANMKDSKHARYGFAVCSTSNCQVSKGHSKVDDVVRRAVAETKGMILTCDGIPTGLAYSAVTGGSIAAAHQVWNQPAQKYLVGQFTPWENYSSNKYGNWQFEATPEKLCKTLRNDGFTQFKDAIADVEILELCENSSYVYKIRVTDIHGTSAVIVRSRNVYHALEDYLYAANFVIMRDGVIDDGLGDNTGINVMTPDGIKVIPKGEEINVATADGIKTSALPNILSVQTASGAVTLDVMNEAQQFVQDAVTTYSDSNFIFIGKGNGHGAGMSQLGIRDLGLLGYPYDEILYKYFPNTKVIPFSEYLEGME